MLSLFNFIIINSKISLKLFIDWHYTNLKIKKIKKLFVIFIFDRVFKLNLKIDSFKNLAQIIYNLI